MPIGLEDPQRQPDILNLTIKNTNPNNSNPINYNNPNNNYNNPNNNYNSPSNNYNHLNNNYNSNNPNFNNNNGQGPPADLREEYLRKKKEEEKVKNSMVGEVVPLGVNDV